MRPKICRKKDNFLLRYKEFVSTIQGEAFAPKLVHCVIQVSVHVSEIVRLVRVRDLFEQDVIMFERLSERHGLLVVHVVVRGAVYQHELFAAYPIRPSRDVCAVVTNEIVLVSRQPHESFRVNGVCNKWQ